MQVLDVEAVGDGRAAELVGLADADAALDPAAGHPHREAVGVVVAAGPLGVLGGRLAAELAAPDDQGLVEQAAPLQVLEQAGDRLVGAAGVVVVVLDEVAVGVPVAVVVGAAGVELDEPDAALDQPAGQQAAAAEVAGSCPRRGRRAPSSRRSRWRGRRPRGRAAASRRPSRSWRSGRRGSSCRRGGRGARRCRRGGCRAAAAGRPRSSPRAASGRARARRPSGGSCPGRRRACSRSTSSWRR